MSLYRIQTSIVLIVVLLLAGCSSDLFNPPEAPVITDLTVSTYEVNPGDTLRAEVKVEDKKDAVLSYQWEVSGGRLIQPEDSAVVCWIVPVAGGDYSIEVKVTNQEDQSSKKEAVVTVLSFQTPFVQIDSPVNNAFFVMHESLIVSARANHENGIAAVNLYVNDVFQKILTQEANQQYTASILLQDWAGPTRLRVEAVARTTQTMGHDDVVVNVEGIVLGK